MQKSIKLYGGIDVGADGGIAFINQDGKIYSKEAIPKEKGEVNIAGIFGALLFPWSVNAEVEVIVIEDVHSLYGMSAKSNFSFGLIKGVKLGFLEVMKYDYGIPYELVQPKRWQKGVWIDQDVVLKDTKATSLNAANRLWPGEDFTKSKRATKPHDGIIDALLMAEFARTHLNN